MIEFEGNIFSYPMSILMDPRENLSYISPNIVEFCHLQYIKFKNLWMVQMATEAKKRVLEKVKNCLVELADQLIRVNLNMLPLGSYDVLNGMDWMENNWSLVN